jgi:hypothetical protein
MQSRLLQAPHIVLGVAELASAEQVRSAFLELTKQFHPARFGRMSPDVQRLSNEVFLGIKSAHDQMMRLLGASLKPQKASQSGGFRAIEAEGSSGTRSTPIRATGTQTRPVVRPSPPASGAIPKIPANEQTQRGYQPPPRSAADGTPVPPGSRTTAAMQPLPRAPTPPRPPSPSDAINPETIRYAGVQGASFDERTALGEAHAFLQIGNWSAARVALHALAAKVPQSKPYRALLCYARGREAQAVGRSEDAALEFQRALQLDPELTIARLALAEVQRRR